MSATGLYPEDIVLENLYFQLPDRNKIQRMYQYILKEVNWYHKYLRCPDLWDKNF